MRAQWICSRERRIALYKRTSINQSINLIWLPLRWKSRKWEPQPRPEKQNENKLETHVNPEHKNSQAHYTGTLWQTNGLTFLPVGRLDYVAVLTRYPIKRRSKQCWAGGQVDDCKSPPELAWSAVFFLLHCTVCLKHFPLGAAMSSNTLLTFKYSFNIDFSHWCVCVCVCVCVCK